MIRLKDRLRRQTSAPVAAEPWMLPHDARATEADILACFRLLLGRNPNREEWVGHLTQTGAPLPQVVTGYLTSLEFQRRGLTREATPDFVVSDLPAFRIYSDLNDLAVGKYVRDNDYEHNVAAVFRRLLRPGMAVLDIGANIGFFALLSASLVGPEGRVFAVEPNPLNAKLLEASRRLNSFGQLTLLPLAAGAASGMLVLTTSHSTGTTSAAPDDVAALLASRLVPAAALDDLVGEDQQIDLIKIDVDGAEGPAMQGCAKIVARCRPHVISEFAPDLLPGISGIGGEDYLGWYLARGYELSVVRPDGELDACGQDPGRVMAAYHASGIDHIDIVASPLGA